MTVHQDRLVSDGEFPLTESDFRMISKILHAEAGISLSDEKVSLVYSRLAKRLRALRLPTFRAYCDLITSPDGTGERGEMIAALTTNVTRFFREPHHFEHLRTKILPDLIASARQGLRIRLWSAACSSGQEPYSMAMTLLSAFPEAPRHNIKILATDIDPNMIRQGQRGVYAQSAMESVPAGLKSRWFTPSEGEEMEVGQELRALVSFRRLNLIGDWPMSGRFHVVFCRNVVIYFNPETQIRMWERFAPILDPQGALYIGHSERVTGPAERLFRSDGITTYRPVHRAPGML
jgi:chemotaxis protein methyltransferase CheR